MKVSSSRPFKTKTVKIPTPERLKNIALHYMGRYAASEASLRRVLTNRLRRAGMAHPAFAADHALQASLKEAIEQIIVAHRRSGILNDALLADMKVASLRRGGRSMRFIQQKLMHGGLDKSHIARALQEHDGEEVEEAEVKAALALAKKKRLGPFRPAVKQRERDRQRDFAAMARAGFGASVIRKTLQTTLDDEAGEEF